MNIKYVVIGGGIAGVCCVEELATIINETDTITLITASDVLKGVRSVKKVTEYIEEFEIEEKPLVSLKVKNLRMVKAMVSGIDLMQKVVHLSTGGSEGYDKLCICCGARPKVLHSSPNVLTLRDVHSVQRLEERLRTAKTIMIVGNGGIALDLMSGLKGFELIWVLKHEHIGEAFFDGETAQFLFEEFSFKPKIANETSSTTRTVSPLGKASESECFGEALGPNWIHRMTLPSNSNKETTMTLEAQCQVTSIEDLPPNDTHRVRVHLSNGKEYKVDAVITGIGIDPSLPWTPSAIHRGSDGGLRVDAFMKTNIEDVFAAGDCCAVDRGDDASPRWFQMRLWTQAKVMGIHAAQCMTGTIEDPGMVFELFTHVTRILGKKVIFLGRYDLEPNHEKHRISYKRRFDVEDERCFAKVVLEDGRVQGAILIGNTDLEEAMENLILDQLDVSAFGEQILDLKIDHIFD